MRRMTGGSATLVAMAALLSAGVAWAQAAPVPDAVAACDRAAAAPHDPTRPTALPGVPFGALDPAAIPVCEAAQRAAPELARIPFQLARLRERDGDAPEAAALYRQAAELGHAAAQTRLAEMLLNGEAGLTPDPAAALRLLRAAADQDHEVALIDLGRLHVEGAPGLPVDEAEALRLLTRAARSGSPLALYSLGRFWAGGPGNPFARLHSPFRNQAEAARLFRLAADQGFAPAQSELALLLQDGVTGVPQDEAEALRLYRLAAAGGDLFAINSLGVFHEEGRAGLPRDDAAAARFYREAADLGDPVAQFNMGRFHEAGRGGLRTDPEAAVRWYQASARGGYPFAQDALRRLGQRW